MFLISNTIKIMTNYNLNKVQQHLFECIVEFDKICREHHINYWLCAGSLLGAVRHGGFIPWDDDFDVGMLRGDFNKLIKIFSRNQHPFLTLQTNLLFKRQYIDCDYLNLTCNNKIRDRRVFAQEQCDLLFANNHQNLFIDIFVFDQIGELDDLAKSVRNIIRRIINDCKFIVKSHPERCRYKILNILGRVCPKIMIKLFSKILLFMANKYFSGTTPVNISLGLDSRISNAEYPINKVFPTKDILFNNYSLKAPFDYDYYLKARYGDYLVIPKPDSLPARHFIEVRFNK